MHPSEVLHVITPYYNPLGWKNRLLCYKNFEARMIENPDIVFTVVECVQGDSAFELNNNPQVNHIGLRTKSIIWNKENTINIAISRLPEGSQYICWCDGDIKFRRTTWAKDTINALQNYDIIQPWSHCYDLGPYDEHLQAHTSLCRRYHDMIEGTYPKTDFDNGHSGYAWAAKKSTLDNVGGLIETAILGAGDRAMAVGLFGLIDKWLQEGLTANYKKPLFQWQERALHFINKNVGYIPGTLEHQWHGPKAKRGYLDRWKILAEHKFDPYTDLIKNSYGVFELAGNKPGLQHDIIAYFQQRDEDVDSIY